MGCKSPAACYIVLISKAFMRRYISGIRAIGVGLAFGALLLAQPPQERPGRGAGPEFVPLREPRFVPAGQANFLKDTDRVVGVSENGWPRRTSRMLQRGTTWLRI